MIFKRYLGISLLIILSLCSIANSASCNQWLEIKESDVPQIWNNYIKARDDSSLKQILYFINSDDNILLIAAEINNREYIDRVVAKTAGKPQNNEMQSDLLQFIKTKYPKNYNIIMHKSVTVAHVLKLLQKARHQSAAIDQQIAKIITNSPRLDYVQKIQQAWK